MSLNKEEELNNIKITYEQKIQLKKDIFKMNKQKCVSILKYLINENVNFTENSNGIFFNLKLLSNAQILELIKIVNNLKNIIESEKKEELLTAVETEEKVDNLYKNYEKYVYKGYNI